MESIALVVYLLQSLKALLRFGFRTSFDHSTPFPFHSGERTAPLILKMVLRNIRTYPSVARSFQLHRHPPLVI